MSKVIPKNGPEGATHVLCYPLCNSRSTLQLQNLVQRLRDDERTAGCPQKAFRLPKSFRLPIANFKFESGYDLEVASALLHSLDINQLLRRAAAASTADAVHHAETSTKVSVVGEDHNYDSFRGEVPPLYVSLIGLSAPRYQRAEIPVRLAYGVPIDSSNRLHFLSYQIRQHFKSAGIEPFVFLKEVNRDGVGFLRPQFISNSRARRYKKFVDQTGSETVKKVGSKYDARGLIAKYTDVVLADNIPLEKLSLQKNFRKATFDGARNEVLLDEYYEEAASIPLPQET